MYGISSLTVLVIVFLFVLTVCVIIIYRLKRQIKSDDFSNSPASFLVDLLKQKFNYVVYDNDFRIIYVRNDQPEILMDFSRESLLGIHLKELDKYVSVENSEQARFVMDNILSAAREKKNRYFEYTSFNKADNKIYHALCFIFYREDGTLGTCATGVEEKNIFRAREHFYNTAINPAIGHVSVGVYIRSVGNENKYDMFNQMAQHFYGTDDIRHSSNWDQKEENYYDDQVLGSDHAVVYEKPIKDQYGQVLRWLQVIKRKKAKEEKEGFFITTTLMDITQRKKEEAELIVTRKNLELAMGAADLAIWLYRCDKDQFFPLYGKLTLLEGSTFPSLIQRISESYRKDFVAAFDRLLVGHSKKEVAICKAHHEENDEDVYYEIQMTVSEIDEKGRVCSLVGTLKDITYQYIHKRELENQEKKMQLAIQTSNLVQWEYSNVTQLFNSSNERIKSNETVLTLEDYVNAVHPDDIEKTEQILKFMNEGHDDTFILNKRLKYSDDDSWHYTTVYGAPFEKDYNGKVTKYTGFRRDDTEWKKMNERLEEEKKRAQESDMLKSAFLANMSHEIRTPLNAIVGFSQLLMYTENLDEKEEYAQIISRNNDLLLRLIGDILDLSKIESGVMQLEFEMFDLSSLFEELSATFKQRAVNPDVEFIAVNPYSQCMVCMDRNRLAQIFTNFAINAIKYTPKGYIKMGYESVDGGIRIYVEDTGIGIPQEKQSRIFHRFQKLDDFAQGTGLGLSICKAIIDLLHGKIGFESEKDKGSTFWAWIRCDAKIE